MVRGRRAHLTSPPSYDALAAGWKALRGRSELSVREVACVGAPRTLIVADIAPPEGAPSIAISAGVHGDEPAAPWALLSLVRDGLLDRSYGYRLWACTNPSGYARGTRENADADDINRSFDRGGRTPESRAILTAYRDRTYALAIDMHEDFEADGFYAYEPVVDGTTPYGEALVAAVDDASLPVQDLDDAFELGYPEEAHHLRVLERGLVRPDPVAERKFFTGTPYSLQMLVRTAKRVLTIESPRTLCWDDRIATHRIAVVAAIASLSSS